MYHQQLQNWGIFRLLGLKQFLKQAKPVGKALSRHLSASYSSSPSISKSRKGSYGRGGYSWGQLRQLPPLRNSRNGALVRKLLKIVQNALHFTKNAPIYTKKTTFCALERAPSKSTAPSAKNPVSAPGVIIVMFGTCDYTQWRIFSLVPYFV